MTSAGIAHFRRATETAFNIVNEAKPRMKIICIKGEAVGTWYRLFPFAKSRACETGWAQGVDTAPNFASLSGRHAGHFDV